MKKIERMGLIPISFFNKIKSFLFRKFQTKNSRQGMIEQTLQENSKPNKEKSIFSMYNNINIEEINELTDNVARSRYKNVDYAYISELAKRVLQVPANMVSLHQNCSYEYSISKEETIKIALDFFKELDQEFYEKALNIIEGKDENISIDIFNVSDYNRNSYDSEKNSEAKLLHNGNKKKIIIPLKGNIEDIYSIVHEISHTYDIPQNLNSSRIMLADVTSECFERMLDYYLENNEDINETLKKDVFNVKKDSLAKTYFSSLDYIIKYEFFNYKNHNGQLKKGDVKSIMSRFTLPPNIVMEYLKNNSQDISYSARYILGGIASEEFLQIYKKDPKESVDKIKRYMQKIKENRGIDALKEIDVNMEEKTFKNEVERVNIYETELHTEKSNENLQSLD